MGKRARTLNFLVLGNEYSMNKISNFRSAQSIDPAKDHSVPTLHTLSH